MNMRCTNSLSLFRYAHRVDFITLGARDASLHLETQVCFFLMFFFLSLLTSSYKALSTTAKASLKENPKKTSMKMPRTTNSTTLTIPTTKTQLLQSMAVTTDGSASAYPSTSRKKNVLPPAHQPSPPLPSSMLIDLLLRIWHHLQFSPHLTRCSMVTESKVEAKAMCIGHACFKAGMGSNDAILESIFSAKTSARFMSGSGISSK